METTSAETPPDLDFTTPGKEIGIPTDTIETEMLPVPGKTVGEQIWFDAPVMLVMLILGCVALVSSEDFWAIPVLAAYASLAGLNFVALYRLRHGKSLDGALFNLLGPRQPAVNLIIDSVFVTFVVVLDTQDEGSFTLCMLTLIGIRLLARLTGQQSKFVWLPALLPLLFFVIRDYYTPQKGISAGVFLKDEILLICILAASYVIFTSLNKRISEGIQLASALAEREQRLRESRLSAEQDARRLAEQVLRLDLLQDGIRAMNSAIELDRLLLMVVNNAVRVLKAEQSSIGLINQETGELVIQCATGVDAAALGRRRFQPGVGVAGWVVQNGKPVIVEDVLLDARYVNAYTDNPIGRTTRSMLCVPLIVEQQVIGTISVTNSQPHALNLDDQSLLTSFAEQAALAVHKSQLLEERTRQSEELQRRGELIASIHSIGQSVLSSLELSQVLHTIISRINELSTFEHGMIYLLNEITGEEVLVATSGETTPRPDFLALHEGTQAMQLWNKARATGTAQSCNDAMCLLCLPLVNRGTPQGCILLARAGTDPFNDVERDTAEKLADAATIAIVNARLFSRVSLQQQQSSALYRLMLKVNAAPNRKQLAQVVCQELTQITGAKSSALLIHDEDQTRFTVWATGGEWEHIEANGVSLAGQGDPFVSSVLNEILQMKTPDLTIVHNVPAEIRQVFPSINCVTIPLAQGGRIYGLLVIDPGANPTLADDLRETVNLAISHSTVALERAELFEQTLTAARQSSMLYSIAAEVQTSLDQATVVQKTVSGALEALPIESCELYIFDRSHTKLKRSGSAIAPTAAKEMLRGPQTLDMDSNPTLLEVLRSPGLITSDLEAIIAGAEAEDTDQTSVVLGRLMGSEEPLGIVRLTTRLPAEEFVHRHATFCQTLLTHSGGALERSRLYTTASDQAKMLRQRAQQLTDILDLGSLSAADVPLLTLLPPIAAGIARSLGFEYVRIGEIGPDSSETEVIASAENSWSEAVGSSSRALSLDNLSSLMEAGTPTAFDVKGAYLNEKMLAEIVPGQPRFNMKDKSHPRELILMPLESTSGGTLGYILAALNPEGETQSEHDSLEVLSIFAQRISLIVENHRVYSQLLDSKRKMETVVLSISDGVIVTDADLNILITNSLADELLGAQSGGSRGYPLQWMINHEELINMLRECVADSTPQTMDVDLGLGRDMRTYQAIVHPINAPDLGVLGAVLTLRDVTIERATERAKSDFLSIVSHELRTPLNSVMGFLDIILMGKTGPITELQTDFLSTAKQEAVVLQRLINDLLDSSQLESGMLRLEMAPLNLSSLIARVADQAVPRMAEDELKLTNNVPPRLLVIGDEIRLEQVFKNLLDNAAKFTNPGGEIVFDCKQDDEIVTISVRDNGCGIPPAQIGDVFERFFQAENNSHKFKRGLGLGLAICKNIVEAHGGRISIDSEVGVGTTVCVELLVFNPESDLYEFDLKTGRAKLTATALKQ